MSEVVKKAVIIISAKELGEMIKTHALAIVPGYKITGIDYEIDEDSIVQEAHVQMTEMK